MTGTSTRSVRDRSGKRRPSPASAGPLGSPLFLLNLKCYPTAIGEAALRLGRSLERLGGDEGVAVAIAPTPVDVGRLAEELSMPVLGQHVDPTDAGAFTGFVPAETLARAGARGSLVNHSEHRLGPEEVRAAVDRLRGIGLVEVVCAQDVKDARRLAALEPRYLAVEPPELIGGDRSVSAARPEVISGTVRAVARRSPTTQVLCGAGVHTRRDVELALSLGSRGILVASAVARSKRPDAVMRELLGGFRR